MNAVEAVAFTVGPGSGESMLQGRAEAIDALRAVAPGMISATLAQLSEDEWLDITVWETLEQARAADEIAASIPGFAAWGERHVAAIGPRYRGLIRSQEGG